MAAGLAAARRRIELAGGDLGAVRVVAVTKGFGVEAVEAASAVGLADVGENYAQELLAKHRALPAEAAGLRWHFLGAVQRNKVRVLAPLVDCWHSVAREVEGVEIARRRPGATVLVELDAAGTPGRNGCRPHDVERLVGALQGLDLVVAGLMTVAPQAPEGARAAFRTLRRLADRLSLPERSMGMSGDLELAVAEGTTMVRLGTALFGRRPVGRAPRATAPLRPGANPSAW
ncbi:MAG: YggS family pyridoxal phosphate enzyme [Acidimicrobiales bacterium]